MLSSGRGRGVHPAHDVDAHALGRLVELDGVAPDLVHRPAVLAEQRGVAEDGLEGRLVGAAPCSWPASSRTSCGTGPGSDSVMKSAGNHFCQYVGVGAVVERGEGHDAGVEPGVAHVADALRRRRRTSRQAIVTASTQGRCGVWPSSCSKPPMARSCQLLAAADDLEGVAVGALPDGQRQAPVALLGDHPVGHRAQPVQLALVAEGRDPADAGPRRP